MVTEHVFSSESELAEYLPSSEGPSRIRIGSTVEGSNLAYSCTGLVEHEFLDQTATFESGTPMADVQVALGEHGQVLPWVVPAGSGHQALNGDISIGEVLAYNYPHPGEAQCGSFRDWVLGCTVVLASGEIIKCGSKAVKSVAGYDLHKLFIGARHSLGIVTRVTVRTYPLANFESLKFNWQTGVMSSKPLPPTPLPSQGAGGRGSGSSYWIQRTLRSDFQTALDAARPWLIMADQDSSTLWAHVSAPLPRYPHDWVLHGRDVEIENPFQRKLMVKMKQKLDPTNKLNPGVFGFL